MSVPEKTEGLIMTPAKVQKSQTKQERRENSGGEDL